MDFLQGFIDTGSIESPYRYYYISLCRSLSSIILGLILQTLGKIHTIKLSE